MSRFDDAYYRRFYGEQGAHDAERIAHLATAVHEMAAWWGVEIQSVLDVGAGMGMWRDWYREHHPSVAVRSVDISEHACRTWGHEQRDIVTWVPERHYDLVVCHSVLQYLGDVEAALAIDHLAAATGWVMYLEAPTRRDLDELVDPDRTDPGVEQKQAPAQAGQAPTAVRPVPAGRCRLVGQARHRAHVRARGHGVTIRPCATGSDGPRLASDG